MKGFMCLLFEPFENKDHFSIKDMWEAISWRWKLNYQNKTKQPGMVNTIIYNWSDTL